MNNNSAYKDTDLAKDTLKLKVLFTIDTYGVFKRIKFKKIHCLTCSKENKQIVKDKIVELITNAKGIKPCD